MNIFWNKEGLTILLFLLTIGISSAQEKQKKEIEKILEDLSFDEVLTTAIYDEHFNSINPNAEYAIGEYLNPKTLSDLVESGLISREDMAGFALPLGVYKNDKPVDFGMGLLDMWQAKANWIAKRRSKVDVHILQKALKSINAYIESTPEDQMTLRGYRKFVITPNLDTMLKLHDTMATKYSTKRRAFMDIIAKNLSPNVLLGYNIQELMPATHMLEDRSIKKINPIFKAFFYDRLWQEAGAVYISNFPARYDFVNSFGPFQMTNIAVKDVYQNSRLIDEFKRFETVNDLESIHDHVWVATAFAYNNWERLSYTLQADSTIQKFIDYFSDWEEDATKSRQLRIFITGVTACMHHHPPKTRKIVRAYFKIEDNFETIHYQMIQNGGNAQLLKYYYSSAEAYLIMKIYHKLFEH
ncbi:MAG: hypothetical protein GY810_32710 [Aureispira sp.]|nr:hypothetical protein [Aureispira sp.]